MQKFHIISVNVTESFFDYRFEVVKLSDAHGTIPTAGEFNLYMMSQKQNASTQAEQPGERDYTVGGHAKCIGRVTSTTRNVDDEAAAILSPVV